MEDKFYRVGNQSAEETGVLPNFCKDRDGVRCFFSSETFGEITSGSKSLVDCGKYNCGITSDGREWFPFTESNAMAIRKAIGRMAKKAKATRNGMVDQAIRSRALGMARLLNSMEEIAGFSTKTAEFAYSRGRAAPKL